MTPRELAVRELKRVLRVYAGKDEDAADAVMVVEAGRSLEDGLSVWEEVKRSPDPEDSAEAAVRCEELREALAMLAADKVALLKQARAETTVQVDQLVMKRGLDALARLRHTHADSTLRETLDLLGYRGAVPSMAFAMAVQEILMAGGRVEGPHRELPEPR